MADFTYEIPDERAYFKAVVDIAKNDPTHKRINLYNIIKMVIVKYLPGVAIHKKDGMQWLLR